MDKLFDSKEIDMDNTAVNEPVNIVNMMIIVDSSDEEEVEEESFTRQYEGLYLCVLPKLLWKLSLIFTDFWLNF